MEINLINGIYKTIHNVSSEKTYFLFINANQFSKAKIDLSLNCMNNQPFNNIHIYEFKTKCKSNNCYINDKKSEIKTNEIDNKLVSSISYIITSGSANYLAIKINPLYNIDYIDTKIEILGGSYVLSRNITNNITNLKSENEYYLFIPITEFKTAIINLSMNYMETQPFSYLYIKEYYENRNSNYNGRNISILISKKIIN